MINIPDFKFCRKLSGILFLTGNISLSILNISDTNWYQFWAGIIFTTCSISLILSSHNHRWLFYAGIASLVACTLTSISSEGQGEILTYTSAFAGIAAAFLSIRAALQRETNKQYKLPKPIDILDKYPLAMAGFIEGGCFLMTAIGATINHDYRLASMTYLWVVAYIFLIFSDEYLRPKIDAWLKK